MNTARNKIDRAISRGWSHLMPAWCGPCTFNRMSRREREDVKRNLQRMQVNNAWRPVLVATRPQAGKEADHA